MQTSLLSFMSCFLYEELNKCGVYCSVDWFLFCQTLTWIRVHLAACLGSKCENVVFLLDSPNNSLRSTWPPPSSENKRAGNRSSIQLQFKTSPAFDPSCVLSFALFFMNALFCTLMVSMFYFSFYHFHLFNVLSIPAHL